jgi:hypothetical protein
VWAAGGGLKLAVEEVDDLFLCVWCFVVSVFWVCLVGVVGVCGGMMSPVVCCVGCVNDKW